MIVAEDITSRFLSVIALFNSTIPLIAIQTTAFGVNGQVALVFNTVLDELSRGLVDEDEDVQEPADRAYWESRASKETLGIADRLLEVLRQWEPRLDLKYNKSYIAFAKDGLPETFLKFRPKRQSPEPSEVAPSDKRGCQGS